jgi:hypothetical protein
MNNIDLFDKQGYVELKKVLSSDMITLISTYAKLDEANDFSLEDGPTPQIHNSHSQYADTLMESLLLYLLPTMEENTGLKLYPAYSYYRVYKPGADLVKHIDRPACEISTTITLEYNYKGADYEWPIFVGNSRCVMTPGDLVIYRGCEVDHWRCGQPDRWSGSRKGQAAAHLLCRRPAARQRWSCGMDLRGPGPGQQKPPGDEQDLGC